MNNVQQLPIGVFDSGVGGLSVLKVLQEQFPNEDFIYIGDNANNPVGNRSDDEITYLACRIAETLEKQPVKLMVIACNTFTVVALDAVRELVSVPVIGVSQGVKRIKSLFVFSRAVSIPLNGPWKSGSSSEKTGKPNFAYSV